MEVIMVTKVQKNSGSWQVTDQAFGSNLDLSDTQDHALPPGNLIL